MGKEETNRFPSLNSFHFSSTRNISDIIDLSDEDDDLMIINLTSNNTYLGTRKRNTNFEKGEYSYSKDKRFFCKLCLDTTWTSDAFYISGCSDAYCSDCMAKYIRSKLEENIINIRCPSFLCSGTLEVGFCRSILPIEDFKRWDRAMCEVLFKIKEKFYCPFVDCSALLINDIGAETVENLECPNCNRMLCGLCKIRSHEGFGCNEFQKLKRDDKRKDVVLANIAEDMRWRQCPKCNDYVAKSGCCNIMTCRCNCRFCYTCGSVQPTGMCNCLKRNFNYLDQNFRPRGYAGRTSTSKKKFQSRKFIHLD